MCGCRYMHCGHTIAKGELPGLEDTAATLFLEGIIIFDTLDGMPWTVSKWRASGWGGWAGERKNSLGFSPSTTVLQNDSPRPGINLGKV